MIPPASVPTARPELPVRQRLLRVTSRLVYRNGVTATGVSAITEAAGVAKMSLYRHFPGGKDELVAAALADQSERTVEQLIRTARSTAAGTPEDADAGPVDPIAVILAVFDVIDANTQAPGWRGCPFLNAAAELPADHPGRAVVLAYRERLSSHFTELLRAAGTEDERAGRTTRILLLLCEGAMAAGALTPHERPGLLARSVAADLLQR